MNYSTGELTIRNTNGNFTQGLDGRYLLISDYNPFSGNYNDLSNVPWNVSGTDIFTDKNVQILPFQGIGNRMVITDANGNLSTQAIPTGTADTDTNDYVSSATYSSGTLTLTRISGGTVTVTIPQNTNNYVSSTGFDTSTGVLSLTRTGLSTLTVDLDNRYLLISDYSSGGTGSITSYYKSGFSSTFNSLSTNSNTTLLDINATNQVVSEGDYIVTITANLRADDVDVSESNIEVQLIFNGKTYYHRDRRDSSANNRTMRFTMSMTKKLFQVTNINFEIDFLVTSGTLNNVRVDNFDMTMIKVN
jgi:hypothetical protein